MKPRNPVFFLLISLFFLPVISFSEPVSSNTNQEAFPVIERDTTQDTIHTYETKLGFLNNDILDLKMEREWLCLKIARIQNQNRIVPQVLIDSRINLTKKIVSAIKNKNKLHQLINKHKNSIKQLNQHINTVDDLESFHSKAEGGVTPQKFPTVNLEKELEQQIAATNLQNAVKIIHDDDSGLILKTTFPILFDSCQYTLKGEYKNFCDKLASLLKPYDLFINVKGFTDDIKIKGSFMTNIELSAKRALAVVRELKRHGMKDSIFKIAGMGEYRKCVENRKICRALSRRVDITVHFHNFGV